MVDGGIISCTEPDALRDLVDAPSLIKSLLGNVGLPSTTPSSLAPSSTPFSLGRGGGGGGGGGPSPRLGPSNTAPSTSPVPWRRANVRHTSNEMYVDIVETLAVTLSPSGRPLSAIASGTIAFTAKVSGVPDLLLHLACPGGVSSAISLPVFHPCVRLGRWTARPGELSFVPPDGRFVLAAYEVDLLGPAALDAFTTAAKQTLPALNIPATVSVTASLGPRGDAFQVRLQLNPRFTGKSSAPPAPARGGFGSRIAAGAGAAGTSTAPAIEDMTVHIPLPASVANILDLRVARGMGDASYAPGAAGIEWRISAREVAVLMAQDRGGGVGCHALLSGTVVGSTTDEEGVTGYDDAVVSTTTYDYNDDDGAGSYQSAAAAGPATMASPRNSDALDEKRRTANKMLMPSAATVSFSVKGWLPSGLKVESLNLDVRKSRGLGGGVTPYKGVKYLCVSRKGVECRC
ncbi:clathrin adaptor, mu subunit [Didymella exigua CBS 183.55]|uniref:Clathrin adaptor, mu subunit n=1 Tax=Didymella exigua CBS 183.55 TaxID=1150837 RepID=A0A6A5R706_9PLEO|nr:clathrin adaptor, mu subunit [Didymella exigua CBS 183.55]KAF1922754.1 clathrin adaptor, mu subunit [Didymella exigua CBS 183.55]